MEDDVRAVEWLAHQHGVAVIPGSACGYGGHVRVAYANLSLEEVRSLRDDVILFHRDAAAFPCWIRF